jgi:hypothetical protein
MHNPTTGEDATCFTGKYYFDEGMPEVNVARSCVRACEKHGFQVIKDNPQKYVPYPGPVGDDLHPYVPPQCMP